MVRPSGSETAETVSPCSSKGLHMKRHAQEYETCIPVRVPVLTCCRPPWDQQLSAFWWKEWKSTLSSLGRCWKGFSLKDPYHRSRPRGYLQVQVCHRCPPDCPGPALLCFHHRELWLVLSSCSGGPPELGEDWCLLHCRDPWSPCCPGPAPTSWSSHLYWPPSWAEVLLFARH